MLDVSALEVAAGTSVLCNAAIPSDCCTRRFTSVVEGIVSILKNPSAFLSMSSRLCFEAMSFVCSL